MTTQDTIPHSKPSLGKKEELILAEVIKSGQIAEGEQVEGFERELAEYIGVKGGVALNSGTSALHLALLALGVGESDQVIVPAFTCCALLNAIHYVRAEPVLVDIDPHSFNLDVQAVKAAIGERTKAVIVPHMFGLAADIDELVSLGIPIIEDCAQSLGATYRGKKAGSFGVLAVFSFYATKLIATGEGGMILANSVELLDKIRDLYHYDERDDYKIRYNYKMTDLQAALGRVQLGRLSYFIAQRQRIARQYLAELQDLSINLPQIYRNREHIFYRFIIQPEGDAKEGIAALKGMGINCARPVYKPLQHYLGQGGLPKAQAVWEAAVSLPIYPSLRDEDAKRVINGVRTVYGN